MKPQRFEIGQAVTPKRGWNWEDNDFGLGRPSSDIFHVSGYLHPSTPKRYYPDLEFMGWYITLREFPQSRFFSESGFDPIELTTEQVTSLLEEPITVEV